MGTRRTQDFTDYRNMQESGLHRKLEYSLGKERIVVLWCSDVFIRNTNIQDIHTTWFKISRIVFINVLFLAPLCMDIAI